MRESGEKTCHRPYPLNPVAGEVKQIVAQGRSLARTNSAPHRRGFKRASRFQMR